MRKFRRRTSYCYAGHFSIRFAYLAGSLSLRQVAKVYIRTVISYHLLSTLLNQIKLVYGRAPWTIHLISAPDQPGRKQMHHYIREAKNLLSYYIYCGQVAQNSQQLSISLNESWVWMKGKFSRFFPWCDLLSRPLTLRELFDHLAMLLQTHCQSCRCQVI